LAFVTIGPHGGKPTVLDDTSYFLSFNSAIEANYICELLSSDVARAFYNAFVFWDSKRPITADLLRRLDLQLLAKELNSSQIFDELFPPQISSKKTRHRRQAVELSPQLWP
jgi:hypothetical protein